MAPGVERKGLGRKPLKEGVFRDADCLGRRYFESGSLEAGGAVTAPECRLGAWRQEPVSTGKRSVLFSLWVVESQYEMWHFL